MDTEQSAVSVEINNEGEVLRQAEALASAVQWKKAASLLQQYSQANTLSVEGLHKWAYYCSHAGDYDSAITIYKNLSERQPSEARWFYYLGFQYQRKEQWAEAIAAYEQCLMLAPRWLKAALRLGDAYRVVEQLDKASGVYREGIQNYQDLPLSHRRELASVYAKLCAKMARALLDKPRDQIPGELEEAVKLLQESLAIEANDADNWYRLGSAFLETGQVDEALDCLRKGEILNPKKEYISHKMAQAHLRKGDPDQALRAYEQIPEHKRVPYILHGMAQCHMDKGETMEAASKLYKAMKREPKKFYHQWDFALALIALGARDQAIEALERANQLFREEYGKDYQKALVKLEEVRSTPPSEKRISFDVPPSAVAEIRFGPVSNYNTERGFGFIKDEVDGANVFFHITRVQKRVAPKIGTRTKYVREVGEKGFQAAKVWLLEN